MASYIGPKNQNGNIWDWLETRLAEQRRELEWQHNTMLKEFSLNIQTWIAEYPKSGNPTCFAGDDGCDGDAKEDTETVVNSTAIEQDHFSHQFDSRAADGETRPISSLEDVADEPRVTTKDVWATNAAPKAAPSFESHETHRWSLSDDRLIAKARHIATIARPRRQSLAVAAEKVQSCAWGSQCCMRIVRQGWFDRFCSLIIIVNSLVVLADVEYQAVMLQTKSHEGFVIAQCFFTAIYTLELCIRVIGFGESFVTSLDRYWNLFDTVVVLCSIVDILLVVVVQLPSSAMIIVRIMRLLRIAKVLRLVRFLRQIRTLAYTLAQTFPSLCWSCLLVTIVMYVFAIILTSATTEYRVAMPDDMSTHKYFGSFGLAMLTLLKTITGGIDWENACDVLISMDSPIYVVVYLLYVIFMNFAMLNVITGFFCEHAFEMARCDKDTLIQEQLRNKKTYIDHFQSYFKLIDEDGSGLINFTELEHMLQDDAMQAYLAHLNISGGNAWQIFRLIDTDGGGAVDIEEFVTGLLTMKGPARNLDLRSLNHDLSKFMRVLSDFMKFTDSRLRAIQAAEEELVEKARSNNNHIANSPSRPEHRTA